jgi:hypothetical protein
MMLKVSSSRIILSPVLVKDFELFPCFKKREERRIGRRTRACVLVLFTDKEESFDSCVGSELAALVKRASRTSSTATNKGGRELLGFRFSIAAARPDFFQESSNLAFETAPPLEVIAEDEVDPRLSWPPIYIN